MGSLGSSSLERKFGDLGGGVLLLGLFLLNLAPAVALRFVGGAMMPFFIVVSFWTALYIITLAMMFNYSRRESENGLSLWSRNFLLLLVIITLIPRALFLGSEALISLDAVWYLDFGKFMSWGDMPYADFYFPYPPMFGYFIYVIMLVAPTVDSYRLLAIGFDVLIVASLWMMSRSRRDNRILAAAPFLYAILPFSIIESGLNGHFEPMANLFILLALWALLEKREGLAAISLALSIATKIYAAFIIPIMFLLIPKNGSKLRFLAICAVTFYLTFLPFAFPVWVRGDFILPGNAMPGLSTGFFDALFGFIFDLSPLHLIAISGVGLASAILVAVFMLKSTGLATIRTSLTYDITAFGLALLFILMAALAVVYPYLPPGPGVFWRFPKDVAIARGLATSLGAFLLLLTAWKRWRYTPEREVSFTSLMLLASVAMLLVITLSKQVFYGWYCLWPLMPLLLLKDRRAVYTILVCMLLIYPSYTHDNFLSLGYSEDQTWNYDFSNVTPWNVSVDFGESGLNSSLVTASIESIDGIGAFSIDADPTTDQDALSLVSVSWTLNVDIPVTNDTEIVLLISSDWDPTFKKHADIDLFFEGLNETGHTVRDEIIAEWQFSPKNISYVLWRFTFLGTGVTAHPVQLTEFELVASNIQETNLAVLIDYIYTTEVYLLTTNTVIVGFLLALPSILAIVSIERRFQFIFSDGDEQLSSCPESSDTT